MLAHHAIRMRQLAKLQFTDIRDGRLRLDDQVILLAGPVRDRFNDYLDPRVAIWPATINPHFFIYRRNWTSTCPVTSEWISSPLAMSAERIHLDRIY